jgi:hypothetical protein
VAIADFPYSFASQPIIDPTTGQPVLNASGGVLIDPRTGSSLPIADMNGNAISSISGNAYGQSQQFRSTKLAVLVKFGGVFVQAPSIEMFDLVQTSTDAVALAQAAQAAAQLSAAAAQAAADAAAAGGGGGGGGVTDHGALSGLADDDHLQYLNTTRGDARYDTKAQAATNITNAVSTASTADRNRANHSGTQTASSISDFTPAVQAVPGFGGGGGSLDTTSTLTTGTASTTSAWSAANARAQILALPNTANFTNATKDIVGALFQGGGGSYNTTTKQVSFPAGGGGGSTATDPVDASAAPYNVSVTGTRDANGAGLLAAVQAAGPRGVSLPSGRYPMAVAFTDEDILIDLPDVTFTQPSVAGDTKPIMTVERTLGAPVAVGPTRIVEWGPRLPGGISSSARYTAIDLTSGGYQNWKAGDLCHISSKDPYPWSWSGQGIADYSTSDGLYWQAGFVPLLGIGMLVINTTNGGPLEQMVVQGATSGATGLIQGDLPGNANGGITATQMHITFASVSGDFQSGETLTRIAGGNPRSSTGGTVAAVGQAVGTVSGSPMLLANRLLDDAYGVVTAANIAAGGTYGAGTRYPNQTDNTVRLRKVDRAPICVVKANFDIAAAPGAQDAYVLGDGSASNGRIDMLKFRGVFGAVFDSRIFNSWTRAVVVTSCYMGRWKAMFDGLPNHAFLDQSAFGYGFECKSASEGNTFQLIGRNLRHAFTTNPNPRTFSTTNNNAALDFGTPKHNTVHDSIVLSSYTNSYDTHPGDYFTRFVDCLAIGGGSGGRYNSDGGAQFASRGFGTQWINCRSINSAEGINWLGPEHDPGFDHTARVEHCQVTGFQSRGFYSVDSVTNRASLVIDGGRFIGDGAPTNAPYQHEAIAVGKGIKVTIKGEVEVGGFNGFPLRMREVSSTTVQSELDIISMLIDYRGTTTSNAQGIRVDGTVARANYEGITLRLASGSIPGGLITNRGGNTVHNIGRVVPLGLAGRTLPVLQTATQGGAPTQTVLSDLVGSGGSGSGGGGTQVSVDGTTVTTLDISSTPVVQVLTIGADLAGPAAGTTIANLSQFQTALAAGAYIVEAELFYQQTVISAGALRFGLGGPGAGGASITNILVDQNTTATAKAAGFQNVLGSAGDTAVTTAGTANVIGLSAGVAGATLPVQIKGRLLVTAGGTLGLMWGLSNGATSVATLKAGSYISFTKVS